MAKTDTMTLEILNGDKKPVQLKCLNIDRPVGSCGPNSSPDVMLVQAMLEKLAEKADPRGIGLDSWEEVPVPDGKWGPITKNAILKYQRRNAFQLLSVDGIVHPADYAGRILSPGRRMTITQLNFDLSETFAPDDYIHEIWRTNEDLRPFLNG
jgi:hypothetical protein